MKWQRQKAIWNCPMCQFFPTKIARSHNYDFWTCKLVKFKDVTGFADFKVSDVRSVFTQHHFPLKTENFYGFWSFIYVTAAFCGPENANFWKRVSKCKFLKTICTCVLCVQSIGMHTFLGAIYWPGMHNTAFLVILQIHVNGHRFDDVVVCKQNFSKMQIIFFPVLSTLS